MSRYVFIIILIFAQSSFAGWQTYLYPNRCFNTVEQACSNAGGVHNPELPACFFNSTNWGYSSCDISCPSGQYRINGECQLPPDCPDGASINQQGQCACDNGLAIVNNSNQLVRCNEFDDDQLCTNSWDLFTSYNCQKKKEDCNASGGTFGWVDGKSTCLPADFLADQDVCSGDFTVVDNGNGSGGVVCTPAGTPPEPITPPENPNAPPPVTGETNQNGIGNNTNGDGAAGSGQTTTTDNGDGTETTESNNASAGGSGCGSPPSCSGDPILCNILKQEFEAKCALNTFNPAKLGNLPTADQIKTSQNVTGFFDDIFNDNGVTSACPSPRSLSFTNQQFSFSSMCSVMEQLRPLVILIFGFFAARLVHKTLMEI